MKKENVLNGWRRTYLENGNKYTTTRFTTHIIPDTIVKPARSSKELTVNQKIKARFKEGQVIAQVVEHVDET